MEAILGNREFVVDDRTIHDRDRKEKDMDGRKKNHGTPGNRGDGRPATGQKPRHTVSADARAARRGCRTCRRRKFSTSSAGSRTGLASRTAAATGGNSRRKNDASEYEDDDIVDHLMEG